MNEPVLLPWSNKDSHAPPETLHPEIEPRLNVFYVHSSNNLITPTVFPVPLRAATMFSNLSLDEVNAFLFDIRLLRLLGEKVPNYDYYFKPAPR